MMNQEILKVNMDNSEVEVEVLDIIDNYDLNKEYIVYKLLNQDEVYVSIIKENESGYILCTIEDPNEFKAVEDYLEKQLNEKDGEKYL